MTCRTAPPISNDRPWGIGRSPSQERLGPARRGNDRALRRDSSCRRLLLATLLLSVVASSGCQTISRMRKADEPSYSGVSTDEAAGSALMNSMATSSNANSPTNPEPMPELTSQRTVNVHLDLGRVFEARGQFPAAEGEYRRAIEAIDRKVDRSTQALAHRRLAAALDRQGKFVDAAPHYQQATQIAPKDHRTWNDAGYSAYLQGRWDEAIEMLRKAEELEPNDSRVLTNLGLALAASGQDDEAMTILSRAGGPSAAEANLAYILAATGRTDEARSRYQRVLEVNPANALAQKALGQLQVEEARSAESVASASAPVDPAVRPATFEAVGSSSMVVEPGEGAPIEKERPARKRWLKGRSDR
ncbi:tetratricopeptide repeat protein [Tautonia marina]|uniref:tetratricopeptide repeat protein n=1 Tax=Tautonia marina TaxID=2653855 RepID=UPI001260F6DB|nr:tetratricopeptide repeat protein [Tautonia marina]